MENIFYCVMLVQNNIYKGNIDIVNNRNYE